jgi:hypothetical protein
VGAFTYADPPVVTPLGLAVGLESFLLSPERVLLVILVGGDSGVEGDPVRGGPAPSIGEKGGASGTDGDILIFGNHHITLTVT